MKFDQLIDGELPDQMGTHGLAAGQLVRAVGIGPTGSKEWFTATLLRIRTRFPPLAVEYKSNARGETDQLVLPRPLVAYLWARDVKPLE